MTETETKPAYDAQGEARRLLREIRAGALATLEESGSPFASLVGVATDHDGALILLLSRLSAHTRNIERDPRASVLLTRVGKGDPLAHPRLTIVGGAERADAPDTRARLRARYLARNPKAALYADFADFAFFRLNPARAHLNGGFAKAADFDAAAITTRIEDAAALIEAEEGALAHLNADHADALALYAEKLLGEAPGRWRATGLDPDGLDLVCGDRTARLAFAAPARSPSELRAALVAFAAQARGA